MTVIGPIFVPFTPVLGISWKPYKWCNRWF